MCCLNAKLFKLARDRDLNLSERIDRWFGASPYSAHAPFTPIAANTCIIAQLRNSRETSRVATLRLQTTILRVVNDSRSTERAQAGRGLRPRWRGETGRGLSAEGDENFAIRPAAS